MLILLQRCSKFKGLGGFSQHRTQPSQSWCWFPAKFGMLSQSFPPPPRCCLGFNTDKKIKRKWQQINQPNQFTLVSPRKHLHQSWRKKKWTQHSWEMRRDRQLYTQPKPEIFPTLGASFSKLLEWKSFPVIPSSPTLFSQLHRQSRRRVLRPEWRQRAANKKEKHPLSEAVSF